LNTTAVACTSLEDWKLVVAIVAAVAAFAGWAAFFIQRRALKLQRQALQVAQENLERLRGEDAAKWDEKFVEYRRLHLKPFAEGLRTAYARFQPGPGAPATWEEAANTARWPRNLPLPGGERFQLWRSKYGIGLDHEDSLLIRFAEAIYAPYRADDSRLPRQRSVLTPEEFDAFDVARGGVADYFNSCGYLRQRSPGFSEFLESRVRSNHYQKLKMVTYLEIALVGALGQSNELGPGKLGLFDLGNLWHSDDPRAR